MPPEKWKFDERGDQYKARKEDARLHEEIDEAERVEKLKIVESQQRVKETEHFLNWIGGMLSRHAVGREPGRHLDMFSPIGDLIEFGERDAKDEIDRHNYPEGNRESFMVSYLKDETSVPAEAQTVGELYKALEAQIEENKKILKKMRGEANQE